MAGLFEKGLQYNTIAGYRSAISAYHDHISGVPVGKVEEVTLLLKGIFNKRPTQPRFNFIWDVEVVIRFIVSMQDNHLLDDKILTKKLTVLLALTSVARAHEICYLDIGLMSKHSSGYTFQFGKITKTTKERRPRPPIKFTKFLEDPKLCVCECIDTYLERSKPWRGNNQQLLLSFISPHNPISPKTVSRWITDFLKMAGIDTTHFTAHSTRSAASSKAKSMGASTSEILKRGHWSKESTFQKYYGKEILGDAHIQSRILASKSFEERS